MRCPPFLIASCLYVFLLDTQKEPKRCPLLAIARGARLRGYSPLRTPKRRSSSKKAKLCRSAARFLTLFCFSPSGPSGAKFLYKGGEYFRPRRGQYGRRPKSVKKIAALLQFLAFGAADHSFGVLRGEHPLRRGCGVAQRSKPQRGFEPHERASSAGWRPSFWPPSALPRNSGTFFATFFGHKKGRPNGCDPL